MNNKLLYESIIKNVAKEVKKALNEEKLTNDEVLDMLKAASSKLPETFDINISIEGIKKNFIFDAIKYCVDPVIENIIAAGLAQQYMGNNDYKHFEQKELDIDGVNHGVDFMITTPSGRKAYIEVKAYKELTNLKPTESQWNADYMLCVKYSLNKSTVQILSLDCITPNGQKEHIKVTRAMINNGINGDYGKKGRADIEMVKLIENDIKKVLKGDMPKLRGDKYIKLSKRDNLADIYWIINDDLLKDIDKLGLREESAEYVVFLKNVALELSNRDLNKDDLLEIRRNSSKQARKKELYNYYE